MNENDKPKRVRRIGFAKGEITLSPSFFEPLPQEILDAFYGNNYASWDDEVEQMLRRRSENEKTK